MNFGLHHHLKMATYSEHSFAYCFFNQISSKLNLFSCRDGAYSLSMVLSVYFAYIFKAFIDLIRLLFFQYANCNFSLKTLQC